MASTERRREEEQCSQQHDKGKEQHGAKAKGQTESYRIKDVPRFRDEREKADIGVTMEGELTGGGVEIGGHLEGCWPSLDHAHRASIL